MGMKRIARGFDEKGEDFRKRAAGGPKVIKKEGEVKFEGAAKVNGK